MSKVLEKKIERQIKSYLDRRGVWYLKVHGGAFQPAGVPDILCCVNGRFVAIEVKRPGGIISPLQKFNIEHIHTSGGHAFVAYSVEDVKRELDALRVPKECD
jgi:Holliday junction resolvase